MNARKPIQFSIASLLVLTTGYAILFSLLRVSQASPQGFALCTLFVTTVLYGQWALFDSQRPYAPSITVSGGLFMLMTFFATGVMRGGGVGDWGHAMVQAVSVLPIGIGIGLIIGAVVDLGGVVCQACLRQQPVLGPLFKSRPGSEETAPIRWFEGRAARLIGLSLLVCANVLCLFWL